MTDKEKEAIETMQHWIEYEKANKEKINKADELIEIQETVLNLIQTQQEEIEKKDTKIALLEQLNKNLQADFDSFKKDEDIHYLDGVHHKQLVEKSVGQKIDKPEECWFDIFEVKIIKNEMLYGITIKEDFINLKQIADTDPENCLTVIAEGPLSGAIYRYNNYGDKEWHLVGTMMGYA